jgi:hypothetical protein
MDSRDFLFLPIEFSILTFSASLSLQSLSPDKPTALSACVVVSQTLAMPIISFHHSSIHQIAQQRRLA